MDTRISTRSRRKVVAATRKKQVPSQSVAKKPAVSRPGVVEILGVVRAGERREKAIIAQMADELKSKPSH